MRTSILLGLSFLPLITLAQWTTPDQNTAVRVGPTATPMSAPGPDGSTYVVWFDNTGGYELRMQRLDAEGNALWQTEGLLVSGEPQSSALFRYDFKSDHAGNAIVAFQDERTDALDIVAYKVSPTGEMLWGEGLELPTPEGTGLAPVIGVLEDDRTVIAWNTDRDPSTVAYQVIPATGVPTLGTPTEITGTGNVGRPRVVPCADGGFWMQWVQQSGNFLSPGTLMAERYDANGAAVPGTNGAVSTKTISGFYFPEPISDGHNGFYVAFNTGNTANANVTDIYVQRQRANGTRWNTTGNSVGVDAATQRYTQTATPVLVNDVDGLMIAYSRTNIGQSEGGIAVQRFDTSGVVQLAPNGFEVVATTAQLPSPFGAQATAVGMVCAYTTGGFGSETVMAVRVDLDGALTSPNGVVTLSSVSSGKDDATFSTFANGQAVAVWQDERTAGGVYAQPLFIAVEPTGIPEEANLGLQLRGNGGHDAELVLPNGSSSGSLLRIMDASGRVVHERQLATQAAGARIALAEPGLSSGVYTLEVFQADRRGVVRWVLP